jgi:rhodanese-related sulfurtransferase
MRAFCMWTLLAAASSRAATPARAFLGAAAPLGGGRSRSIVRLMATEVSASHILVGTEELAELAQERVSQEDFAEVAREMSSCPSKSEGGSLGWFQRGQMVPEFDAAAFAGEVGSTTKVRTQFGWHVLRVDGKREVRVPEQMTVTDLGNLLRSFVGNPTLASDVQIVDVREADELRLASLRLPAGAAERQGVFHLPLSEFDLWAETLSGLVPDKKTVVICHHGMRSMQLANYLCSQRGFEDVHNVSGGIDAYARGVDETVGTY